MAGLMSTITVKQERRPCIYKDGQYMFHKWIDEGQEVRDGILNSTGAILEDMDGGISTIWDISDIKFVNTESTNLCDTCCQDLPECQSRPGDIVYGDGKGNDNVVLCRHYEKDAYYKEDTNGLDSDQQVTK